MLEVLDSYENALASSKRIVAVLETDRDATETGADLKMREGRIEV